MIRFVSVEMLTMIVCNFECAVLLAKWLLTLAAIGPSDPPVSPEEKSLLGTVRRMLDETEFAVPIDPCLAGSGSSRSNSGSSASGVGGQSLDMVAGSAISSAGSTGTTAAASSMSDSARLRQLAAAVVRLWAETFKGSHVFDVVKVMGASLDGYADLIERRGERTP